MKVKIVNSYELRDILKEELNKKVKYFVLDEPYFDNMKKDTASRIIREISFLTKKEGNELVKVAFFNSKQGTEELYEFIQELNKENIVFATIFNREEEKAVIAFANKDNNVSVEGKIYEYERGAEWQTE
jgi:hypothetical protein